jgi:hypothetical protein
MCEHYVARSERPFRLDVLWPFTERLERYGLAGFGWGAAWRTADGALDWPATSTPARRPPRGGRGDRDGDLLIHLRRRCRLSAWPIRGRSSIRQLLRSATTYFRRARGRHGTAEAGSRRADTEVASAN